MLIVSITDNQIIILLLLNILFLILGCIMEGNAIIIIMIPILIPVLNEFIIEKKILIC